MKSFETHNGKVIQLVRNNKTAQINIQFTSGGELPEELTGLFTTERFAELAVNAYLEKTKGRKKTDAKGDLREAD